MLKIKPEKRRIFLACVVMALLLAVVGILQLTRQKSVKEEAGMTAETLIAKYAKKQKDLNLVTAVLEDSRLRVRVYGKDGGLLSETAFEIGEGGEVPADADSEFLTKRFEIGSLTKTFVGALFGKYVSEGKVSLSDPVSRYVDFGGKYDPTLLELLTHCSAYGDYRTNGFIQMAKFRFGGNPYRGISTDKIPTFMRRFSTRESGPFGYSFSNFGYAVLGCVIEKIEGRSASEAIEAYANEALGLPDTYFELEPQEKKNWKWNASDAFLPAAGLHSDLLDLARYVQLYFDDRIDPGRTLSITPQKTAENAEKIGLGWGIRTDGVVGHGGETSNSSAQILLDPQKHRAVIVLSNRAEKNGVGVPRIAEQIYLENFGTAE